MIDIKPMNGRSAVTLPETLIVAAVLALLLIVVALGLAKVRSDLKHGQAWELLANLDKALDAYHQDTGIWPACEPTPAGPAEAKTHRKPTIYNATDCVIAALATEPASQKMVQKIPDVLLVPGNNTTTRPADFGTVRDAWGRKLRCITAQSPTDSERRAVAANSGKPIFISPGADGKLGTNDIVAAADNLRSDELPR